MELLFLLYPSTSSSWYCMFVCSPFCWKSFHAKKQNCCCHRAWNPNCSPWPPFLHVFHACFPYYCSQIHPKAFFHFLVSWGPHCGTFPFPLRTARCMGTVYWQYGEFVPASVLLPGPCQCPPDQYWLDLLLSSKQKKKEDQKTPVLVLCHPTCYKYRTNNLRPGIPPIHGVILKNLDLQIISGNGQCNPKELRQHCTLSTDTGSSGWDVGGLAGVSA